jgi:hypothetical protein
LHAQAYVRPPGGVLVGPKVRIEIDVQLARAEA